VVELDQQLRRRVVELSKMMHELFEQGITPKPVKTKACDSCSLVDICLPKTADRKSVKSYLDNTAFQMGGE
jgi:CRISPR-associated exonuclease Cas4